MPMTKAIYPLRAILTKAWDIARAGVRRFGGTARAYLAAALRQAWAEVKALTTTITTQRARILAEVARIRAENTPLGLARRCHEEAAFAAKMEAHRAEMRARAVAYRARWGRGAAAAPKAA